MLYYILYIVFYLISFLPLPVLYILSDIFAFVLYDIIRYRREVVRTNLQNSFPEKKISEIVRTEKEFYRFLCRTIVETIKLLSISESELKKRCRYTQRFEDTFKKYYNNKQDVFVLMGHLGNWEWAGACFNLYFPSPLFVLYHPLSNKAFDRLMQKIRARFGTRLIPMNTALKHILKNTNQSAVFTFIADQCPSPQNAFWMTFLNQETPVYYGPEQIAKKLKCPVIFVSVNEIKKGYYQIDADELNNISDNHQYPVMQKFMCLLEEKIKQQPHIWLWSHKRWKHKKGF